MRRPATKKKTARKGIRLDKLHTRKVKTIVKFLPRKTAFQALFKKGLIELEKLEPARIEQEARERSYYCLPGGTANYKQFRAALLSYLRSSLYKEIQLWKQQCIKLQGRAYADRRWYRDHGKELAALKARYERKREILDEHLQERRAVIDEELARARRNQSWELADLRKARAKAKLKTARANAKATNAAARLRRIEDRIRELKKEWPRLIQIDEDARALEVIREATNYIPGQPFMPEVDDGVPSAD